MPRRTCTSEASNIKAVPWIVTSILILVVLVTTMTLPNNTPTVNSTNFQFQIGEQKSFSQANFRQLMGKYTLSAQGKVLAVNSQDNSGVIGYVNVEIRPGSGRILVDTSPFVEVDTQYSAETAVAIAQEITEIDLSDRDVTISFDIDGQVIGGPSAGASMTATVMSAITDKIIRENVAITGTIQPDGVVGPVGGLLEKAQAAAENGATLFLVPQGQSMLYYYEPQQVQERIGGFIITRTYYVPKELDLSAYTMEQWNMETREVANMEDAADLMLKSYI